LQYSEYRPPCRATWFAIITKTKDMRITGRTRNKGRTYMPRLRVLITHLLNKAASGRNIGHPRAQGDKPTSFNHLLSVY
jgi:hypothetical protein